jgi:hypothetical protein
MMTSKKQSPGWSVIRQHLNAQARPALLALVKDLYDASASTRDFLHARVLDEGGDGTAVERYRRTIIEQFYPARGFGKLKLAEARHAIREYRRATGNLAGTIDLMLTYVENGTQFTRQYGDLNAAYYHSLESVLHEMTQLLRKDDPALYPQFRERIQQLDAHADHIGWGYGDFLRAHIRGLDTELAGE